jgi:hypothetical protein
MEAKSMMDGGFGSYLSNYPNAEAVGLLTEIACGCAQAYWDAKGKDLQDLPSRLDGCLTQLRARRSKKVEHFMIKIKALPDADVEACLAWVFGQMTTELKDLGGTFTDKGALVALNAFREAIDELAGAAASGAFFVQVAT